MEEKNKMDRVVKWAPREEYIEELEKVIFGISRKLAEILRDAVQLRANYRGLFEKEIFAEKINIEIFDNVEDKEIQISTYISDFFTQYKFSYEFEELTGEFLFKEKE